MTNPTKAPATHVPPSPAVEERHGMTLEALADVDAGRVIDHQAIQAWASDLTTGSQPAAAGTLRSTSAA